MENNSSNNNSSISSGSSSQQQQQHQEPQLKIINESNIKPYTFDLVKEFKANGNFDRFRRDCFNEIISQVIGVLICFLFFFKAIIICLN
jgi:hypothetical protein